MNDKATKYQGVKPGIVPKRWRYHQRWRYGLEVNRIISRFQEGIDGRGQHDTIACAESVAAAIGSRAWTRKFPELAEFAAALRRCHDVEDFDGVMNQLYDFCDSSGIWLGLP